jgi:hypothetical protein
MPSISLPPTNATARLPSLRLLPITAAGFLLAPAIVKIGVDLDVYA